MSKSQFREDSLLQKVDQEVIDMRHMLLLKFNIAFKWVIKFINVAERNNQGSLSYLHFKSRYLSAPSVINQIIDKQLNSIPDGGKAEVNVNRQKAQIFHDEGNIDHEGKYSIFG